jgi:hypothetical protein
LTSFSYREHIRWKAEEVSCMRHRFQLLLAVLTLVGVAFLNAQGPWGP